VVFFELGADLPEAADFVSHMCVLT